MKIRNQNQWEKKFMQACREGKIEDIRHLCQKQYLDLGWADIHGNGEQGFRIACDYGHLEVVKYLLTAPEIIEAGHTFADLHTADDGFRMACRHGHLDVIRYLLTSPDLIKVWHSFANVQADDNDGFRWACYHGQLEVIKYLLTSPELKEAGHAFADLHARNDEGFRRACANEKWHVVRWLIMDYGIEKTYAIKEMIQDHPQAQEYFRAREEFQAIHGVLQNNETGNRHDSSKRTDTRVAQKPKKL